MYEVCVHTSVPRSHVNYTSDINARYSRPAKRAIPCVEETNKEERRRSVTSLGTKKMDTQTLLTS